jgi:hypothetical protein
MLAHLRRKRNLISDENLQGEEIMIEIRKTIILRETVFSELGVEAAGQPRGL